MDLRGLFNVNPDVDAQAERPCRHLLVDVFLAVSDNNAAVVIINALTEDVIDNIIALCSFNCFDSIFFSALLEPELHVVDICLAR